MAGIGFELRRLTSRGDLLGLARGYVHASVSTSGGWLFTILALTSVTFFGPSFAAWEDLTTFRLVIVYNFAFSLVLTGPLTMVLTRYLSDSIFARRVDGVPGWSWVEWHSRCCLRRRSSRRSTSGTST